MCDTVFAFGQWGGLFVESVSARNSTKLPANLQALFDNEKVDQTYCLALGEGDSYAVSYLGYDGFQHIQAGNLPPRLHNWLMEKDVTGRLTRELETLKISLGPYNESFLASDGVQHIWHNLPPRLNEALKERRLSNGSWKDEMQTPKIVALGAMGNYLLITQGGGGSWMLNHYVEMDTMLSMLKEKQKWSVIRNVVLDPHRFESSVIVFANGTVLQSSQIPPHCDTIVKRMVPIIRKDTENEIVQNAQTIRTEAEYTMMLNNLRAQQFAQQRQLLQMQQQADMDAYSQMIGAMLALIMRDWSLNNN